MPHVEARSRLTVSSSIAVALVVLTSLVLAINTARSEASTTTGASQAGSLPRLTSFNKVSLGDGFVETLYAADSRNRPTVLAVRVDAAAMTSLPTAPQHDGQTCYDKAGDGIDLEADCAGGHERNLWLPELDGMPFKWLMFNWQGAGHGPTHVFDEPHFDLHFFIQDFSARNQIRTGPCNLVINCDDQATATKPVPAPYGPVGWGMPGAAGRMGNHIIDPSAAPANGDPFTQAFAYGTWDGHISFWEPVVNTDWFSSTRPAADCRPIPQTPQVELTGYYPTQMCTRYGAGGAMTFTFEKFAARKAPAGASPPAWSSAPGDAGSVEHQH